MTKNEALRRALEQDIIRMAREAGFESHDISLNFPKELERFAALVAAAEREKEKERQRYDIHSCGPDCDRYICVAVRKARQEERNRVWTQEHWTEYERSIADAEREACILALERNADKTLEEIIAAIRARSST